MEDSNSEIKKRKNQPGDIRTPGTKDYSVILGNLISYKHQLVSESDLQQIGALMAKIAQKLEELGFKEASDSVKSKLGRRKSGKYQDLTLKKKQDVIEIAAKHWEKGTEKNEKAKIKKKEEAKSKSAA
jgi:hypothetical protein